MEQPWKRVDAALQGKTAVLELVRYDWAEPADAVVELEEDHRLDLCLTPRPADARACYSQHWPSGRFERLGEVFFVPAGHLLRARSGCGRQMSLVCRLRGDAIREWTGSDLAWTRRQLEESLNLHSPAIRAVLLRLGDEVRSPGFAGGIMIELLTGQLAVELARFHGDVSDEPMVGGLASWRLKRIDDRLHEARDVPTLTELSDLCGLSTRQLSRGFRASRGMSIGHYVAAVRVDRAKTMLAGPNSIKRIAFATGYGSQSTFSHAFRQATGETPRQFRQKIRG